LNSWYIAGLSIIVLGIFLFIYFATRKKYRDPSAAPNYENIRNKLTVRELEEEPEEDEEEYKQASTSGLDIQGLIMSIVVVSITLVIGVYVLSIMSTAFTDGSASQNVTSQTIEQLSGTASFIPIIAVIGFAVMMLAMLSQFFIGTKPDEESNKKEAPKKHYKRIRDTLTVRNKKEYSV
jgi:heme/copper-type cytochrome/quinol oxidase subunit 2